MNPLFLRVIQIPGVTFKARLLSGEETGIVDDQHYQLGGTSGEQT